MKKEHKLSQFKHSQFHYIFFKQSKLSKILDKVEQAKCIIIFGTNLVIQRKMIARFSTPYGKSLQINFIAKPKAIKIS